MKLSIITPSYNQVNFIERTIRSVIEQQGNFELEYLIMDGGSTDGSVDIIKRYAAQDARIRWLSEPDNGQSDAINKGLHMATGNVVAYLNSDDTYLPGALQTVAQFFVNHLDVQWVYGRCKIINSQNQEIRQWITWYKNILGKTYSYKKLLAENFISQPACFWRRAVHEEHGYVSEQEHLCMDYELWLRLGQFYTAGTIHEYLANFRYYTTSKSGQFFSKQFKRELDLACYYADQKKYYWVKLIHRLNYYKIISIYTILQWL